MAKRKPQARIFINEKTHKSVKIEAVKRGVQMKVWFEKAINYIVANKIKLQ